MTETEIKTSINGEIVSFDTPAYKKRKFRWGDRRDGRVLRSLPGMHHVMPYIMKTRDDAQVFFEEVVDITEIEDYLRQKHDEGFTDMSVLHVLLAAYVRVISERPGINRFVAGRRIYARKSVEVVMTVKKEMSLEAPETSIKVEFDPRDNIYNVYHKFREELKDSIENCTDVDKTAAILKRLPRFLMRITMSVIRFMEFHGILPKSLMKVSPFHGSIILTAMGSLGVPAVYHHLYDFGTLPVFLSYGRIYTAEALKRDGTKERRRYIPLKIVADERICEGYYFASAFKKLKKILSNPTQLDTILTEVKEDID